MFTHLNFLPVITATLLSLTFIISYTWAVGAGLVPPVFPYISTTGAYPPVSCFFSLMLNIASILLALIMYIRHHQLVNYAEQYRERCRESALSQHSKRSAVLGTIAAVGLMFVGDFQSVNIPSVHILGAFAAFGIGTVYMIHQTFISFRTLPYLTLRWQCYVRATCSAGAVVTLFSMLAFFTAGAVSGDDIWFIFSAASEWAAASAVIIYVITFTRDFSTVRFIRAEFSVENTFTENSSTSSRP